MNTRINTRCFNFGYDAEGLQRANTYSNKKGYTAMGGTTDPNVIMNLQNSEVDVVVLNGNRSAQSTWAVYIPMKKHLESMGIVCEMNIESYNHLNYTIMEAQESIQQEASVDPIASASSEQAVIAQTEMKDGQSQSTTNEEQSSVEPEAETNSAETNVRISAENPEQVELTPALLATVLGFLKCGFKTKMRTLVSFQDSKNDIKLVFVKGNRNVYSGQIDKLWKDIADRPVKKFYRSCVVVNAKTILERNLAIPEEEKSRRVHLLDIYGNEVTLETPGIENCWAVIDGQHRLMVCIEHPEADLDLELLDDYHGDIMELIKIFNSIDRNWSLSDYNQSNIATGKISSAMMSKSVWIKSFLNCSDKVANFLLTFKKDAIRKSSSVKGIDDSGYSEAKGERGLNIARAIKYRFGDMTVKVQLVEAICKAYSQLEDGKTTGMASLMVGFIAEISDSMKKTIVEKMKSADFGTVTNTFTMGFEKYVKLHKDDIDEHIKEIQGKIDAAVPMPDLSVKSDANVKDGFPCAVLGQRLRKSVEDVEAKVTKLVEKEKTSKKVIDELNAKSKLSDKEKTKLEDEEAKLNEIQGSLSVTRAYLEELKAKRDLFQKAA